MTSSTLITDYLGRGTHANRPATPNIPSGGTACYYETDTTSLFAWTGAAWTQVATGGALPTGANPSATASDVAVNGSAATFMRSDGAPAIQKTSASVFGLCKVDGTSITAASGVISAVGGGGGAGLFQQIMSATPTSTSTGFTTWQNQNSATVTDGATGVNVFAPSNSSSQNCRLRTKTAPGTPYTAKALMSITGDWQNHYCQALFGWTDGTKIHTFVFGPVGSGTNGQLAVSTFATVTATPTTQFASSTLNPVQQVMWLKLTDDGTNIGFSASMDGVNFIDLYAIAKASGFLGSGGYTNLCYGINPYGSGGYATLLSYTQA